MRRDLCILLVSVVLLSALSLLWGIAQSSEGELADRADDPNAPTAAHTPTGASATVGAVVKLAGLALWLGFVIDLCVVIHFSVAVAKRLFLILFRRVDPITPRGFEVIPK